MLKIELAELLASGGQTAKSWMKSSKREMELVLEIRTGSPEEAKAAREELIKIRNAPSARGGRRQGDRIRRTARGARR